MDADLLVVGAGPAGLHAALKAAVLNHTVLLLDKGRRFSRVAQAPALANVPLRPGISGEALLEEGRRDLERFADKAGKRLVRLEEDAEAVVLRRIEGGFELDVRQRGRAWTARAPVVILATGVVDRKPGIGAFERTGHSTLAPFIHQGKLGYCLLCEGWSLGGRRVAVFGHGPDAVSMANDVCGQFEGEVSLFTDGHEPGARAAPAVRVETARVASIAEGPQLTIALEDGRAAAFDKVMLSLGWHRVNSDLARMAGGATTEEGYVVTDAKLEVLDARGEPVRGLFAVGDVRDGPWKQVPLAWADAELAVIAAYAERLPAKSG